MLTRSQDYALQQPSLTRKKLRRLEITAGAPKYTRRAAGIWSTNELMRVAELELARQAEASYKRSVADWKAASPKNEKAGASVTAGARITKGPPPGATSRSTPRSSPGRLLFDTSSGSRPSTT